MPRSARVWGSYLVMGALNNAIPFSLIFWGQTQIESGLASILNGTSAVFGAVVAGVLLVAEPLTAKKIIGAAVGVVGVAFWPDWSRGIWHSLPSSRRPCLMRLPASGEKPCLPGSRP